MKTKVILFVCVLSFVQRVLLYFFSFFLYHFREYIISNNSIQVCLFVSSWYASYVRFLLCLLYYFDLFCLFCFLQPMNLDCQLFLHTIILITMASGDLSRVPEVKDMAISNTLDLIRQCGADLKGQNVFLAPYSITTALAMTYMGAQGDTAAEMRKVLKWSSAEAPTKGFGSYLTLLQEASSGETPGYILVGAQRIYIDGKLSLKPEFSSAVQQHFASDAKAADFVGNPDGERVNINSWVMDQTRGKIRDLLPSGSIDSLTAMVLVQATYFKGNWMHKFDAKDTKPADFFTPQGKVTVNMMQQRRNFNYGASPELKCTAVELPYASNSANARRHDLSMLILLPDARDGLDEMEANLTHDSLEKIRSSLSSQKVIKTSILFVLVRVESGCFRAA